MFRLQNNVLFKKLSKKSFHTLIDIAPEVKEALKLKKPIVALESTIITHGMPHPQNIQTAYDVESIVRNEGSIPATCGILNGRIKVGLDERDLEMLGKATNNIPSVKTSRRDLAYIVSKGLNGGTTVAGTIIIANMVGIDVFATGGIGGVHRDAPETMDISADLIELGRSSIAVVSSGVKSILDIPKTLEYLETHGVTVTSYQSPEKDFPAFYLRKSGIKAPYNISDPAEAARLINTAKDLKLNSGILIGVPIPEEFSMDEDKINSAIEMALEKAKTLGISGKGATPFLLSELGKITQNKSLQSNIALIKNNARVGAQIANELSKLKCGTCNSKNKNETSDRKSPVVIGGSNLDRCVSIDHHPIELNGATYHSKVKSYGGGVGRNMAEGLAKLHGHVELISKVGNDRDGDYLLNLLPADCRGAIEREPTQSTATCTVVFDGIGDSKIILASMDIHKTIDSTTILRYEHLIKQAPLVIFDGNISIDTMSLILELCQKYKKPAFFEPTDMIIATKPFTLPADIVKQIKFISPNIDELNAIAMHFGCDNLIRDGSIGIEKIRAIKSATEVVSKYVDNIIVTFGSNGILLTSKNESNCLRFFNGSEYIKCSNKCDVHHRFYNVKKLKNIENVSGAGDCFNAGFISAMLNGCSENICVAVGIESANFALKSSSAVPTTFFDRQHECWSRPTPYKNI